MRDHLERTDTALEVSPTASAGAVTASRRSGGTWLPGLADLKIEAGSLVVSADSDGTLTVQDLALDLGPITIPETVLGYGVELTDIHLGLVAPMTCIAQWFGDNEAHCNATADLALAWSLVNHGTTSPLGSPDLPPVPVEIVVTGDRSAVHAELRVQAPGTLWNWAGLFQLDDLSLILAAETP